ncbi:MAG TPA: ABC transporter permease [Mucilaginibacter sp.]|nr:ABC transporter permease [Mucilaginibacter sp.]
MDSITFHIRFYDLIFPIIVSIGLTFALLLWFSPKINRPANRFLALALSAAILYLTRIFCIDIRLETYFPYWSWLPLQFSLALGPLIYFYVLKITQPEYKLRGKDILHFSPLLLELGGHALEIGNGIKTGAAAYQTPAFHQLNPVLQMLALVSVMTYLYLSHRLIRDFYRRLRPVLMDRPHFAFRRLDRTLFLIGLLCVLVAFSDAFCLTVAFVLIAMAAEVILKLDSSDQLATPITDRSDAREKGRRLKEAVSANRLYEDAELTLTTLAVKLMIHPRDLSRIINIGLEKNFSDFINEFRVREVGRKMQDSAYDRLTLLGIAYESGFNSQRTFNRVFKEMTGKTPVGYKNSLKKELPNDKLATASQISAVILRSGSLSNWAPEKLKRNFMFRNYLKIAWRNLLKNKTHSFINITGLSVGMAVAILICLWIWDELSYNKYHEHYDRIVQVMQHQTTNGDVGTKRALPIPLGVKLRNDYKADFKYVVLSTWTEEHVIANGDKKLTSKGNFMQPEAPDMLTLKMLRGNRSCLTDPSSVLLSASLARSLFGDANPMDRMLKMDNQLNVKVTGVYEDLPQNATFNDMAFIAPWDLYVATRPDVKDYVNIWANDSWQIFAQLQPGADINHVAEKIKDLKLSGLAAQHDVLGVSFKAVLFLQPMSKWRLYQEFKNGVNIGGAIQLVWLFGIIGVFVLLLACINFMNLCTARSEKRAKEVGIRKTAGSLRSQLIVQFFTESVLVAFFAFLLAVLLVTLALPWFNQVADKRMAVLWSSPVFWLLGIIFSLITGVIAGSYPAFYLSSFQPVQVLKGTFKAGPLASLPRKILVVLQFVVSVTLIIGTIVVFRQVQFTKNRPVGYSRSGLLQVAMRTPDIHNHFGAFRNELLRSGAVAEVAESEGPVTFLMSDNQGITWKGKDPNLQDDFGTVPVTPEFGKTIGWKIKEGRDLSRDYPGDSSAIILNEAAVKFTGLKNPVGEVIKWDKNYRVIGVVKDIVMDSPHDPVRPTMFYLLQYPGGFIDIRINPAMDTRQALDKIEAVFKRFDPASPFDFKFTDTEYAKKFDFEERIGKLTGFATILAIFISCMGLFGMASFMAEQRTKEIGIRKVLGASVFSLWRLMSKEFALLVIIALAVAIPIAIYVMNGWLQQYKYQSGLSCWIFAGTALGAILITLLTVSFQSIKAALANPVSSLKTE